MKTESIKRASILESIFFNNYKPDIQVILESPFSKEIQISFKSNQLMKKHQTKNPIIIHIVEGEIEFDVYDKIITLKKGDMITLEGNTPHSLKAVKESIVRLSIYKNK